MQNKSTITNEEMEELREIGSSVRIIEMPELFKEVHNGEHCEFCKNNGKDTCVKINNPYRLAGLYQLAGLQSSKHYLDK